MPSKVPLEAVDPTALAARLRHGERPQVVLADSAGLGAGVRGTVIAVGDPAASPECVSVRVGADVLPFAPAELRQRAAARSRRRQPEPPPGSPAESPAQSAVEPSIRPGAAPTAAPTAPTEPAQLPGRSRKPVRKPARPRSAGAAPVAPRGARSAAPPAPVEPLPATGAPAAPRARASSRATKQAADQPLAGPVTVTLRHGRAGWSVHVTRRGARAEPPVPVPAGRVLAAAEALGVPDAIELAAAVVERERAVLLARAEAARADFEAAQAALTDFDQPGATGGTGDGAAGPVPGTARGSTGRGNTGRTGTGRDGTGRARPGRDGAGRGSA